MGAGGVMGAMTDFDIAYGIVAVDKTADGVNSAVAGTEKGTASIAEQFFFMSQAVNQAIAYVQEGFNATVGATMAWADSIRKMSDVTGMSTDEIQRLKAAGLETGVSMDAIAMSARMMTQRLGDSGTAGQDLRKRLADLGVTTVDSAGHLRSTNDVFWDTLRALNGIQDPMARNNLAVDTLGRSWYQLAPMIREYDKAASAAAQATPVSSKDIDAAHDMGIEMDKLNEKFARVGRDIGRELLPATQEWMDLIEESMVQGAPLMEFFGWLDGALIRAAQGFHIVSEGAKIMWLSQTGQFAEAKKTAEELNNWIQAEQVKQGLRESGYFEGAVYINGAWVDPNDLKDKTPPAAVDTSALDKEDDRVKALTDSYKDYQDEIKKLADEKKKLYDGERDYYEDVLDAGGDVAKIRDLAKAHRRKERTGEETLQEDVSAANAAAAEFNAIKAGVPLAQVKGTSQYTTAQAQSTTNLLQIENLNLSEKYTYTDFKRDYEKDLAQQRTLKAVKPLQ